MPSSKKSFVRDGTKFCMEIVPEILGLDGSETRITSKIKESLDSLVRSRFWKDRVIKYATQRLQEPPLPRYGSIMFRATRVRTKISDSSEGDIRIVVNGTMKAYSPITVRRMYLKDDAINKIWSENSQPLTTNSAQETISEGLWKASHEGEIPLPHTRNLTLRMSDVYFAWEV